jgi:hypothetical protein
VVYLACPYTHKNKKVQEQRAMIATLISAELSTSKTPKAVISPLTLSHAQALMLKSIKTDWAQWANIDLSFIRASDELYVIHLPGWERSVGVQAEIAVAKALNKQISRVTIIKNKLNNWEIKVEGLVLCSVQESLIKTVDEIMGKTDGVDGITNDK